MPRLRSAERALTLLASSSSSQSQSYICNACRSHLLRHQHQRTIHTTSPFQAEQSWLKRLQTSVFGSTESKEADRKREEARKKRVEELSNQSQEERSGEVIRDRKGREFEVAALVDPSLDKGYVPAQTWDGLDRVGSEAWVRARADGGEKYYGFGQPRKMALTNDQWKWLLHHVTVEVLALRQAGRNVDQVCYERPNGRSAQMTRNIKVSIDGDEVVLTPQGETLMENVLANIPETSQEVRPRTMQMLVREAEIATGIYRKLRRETKIAQENDDWMQIPLADPAIKLTILKRTTQLTGHRLRDTAISSVRTLADLYDAFKTKEKPKKLAQSDKIHALKRENANVTFHSSRRTSIDKHKAVGRWKVIEDELRQRDLPVTGTRWKDAKTILGVEPAKKKKGRKGAGARTQDL